MTALSKSMGSKKRALLISIRHVRCKAGSRFGGLPVLDFAHRNAEALRNYLITSHGYEEDDIILMMDVKSYPEHLWPTRERILHQMGRLTDNAPENCHYFFYFSGHGLEEEGHDRASMRADGRDGEIICADGKPILDYILHDRLITPLEKVKGSKLFALFDCCHSETLLDLQRGNGPNSYSRVWNIGPGQLFKDLVTVVTNLLKLNKKCSKFHNVPPASRRASTKWYSPPESKIHEVGELSVICLSACRDTQLAYDDCERELTFTKCFLDAMAGKPNISWAELRDVLKELVSEIRTRYEETYLRGSSPDDGPHEPWTQEPRYSTSSHTDLRKKVSL